MKYAIFTVCMPEFSPEEAAPKIAAMGYDGVEWRVTQMPKPGQPVLNFWSGNRCTVDIDDVCNAIRPAQALCRKHKLAMPALGTYLHYGNLKGVEACLDAAAIAGAKCIRVGVDGYNGTVPYSKLLKNAISGFAKVEKLARKYKVKACPEIHMGIITPSCSSMLRLVEHFDPKYVGVVHDAGNMKYEGFENWQMGLEMLGKYLAHVHVKNARARVCGARTDTTLLWTTEAAPLHAGMVDWHVMFTALKKVGYDGWVSVEDFSTEQPTLERLTNLLVYLKGVEKTVKAAK